MPLLHEPLDFDELGGDLLRDSRPADKGTHYQLRGIGRSGIRGLEEGRNGSLARLHDSLTAILENDDAQRGGVARELSRRKSGCCRCRLPLSLAALAA